MKSAKAWLLYVVLLVCMAYSALALTARPAYAAGCNCQQSLNWVIQFCGAYGVGHGGPAGFWCTDGAPSFNFYCRDGTGGTVNCP
jgi:hypothetical protein